MARRFALLKHTHPVTDLEDFSVSTVSGVTGVVATGVATTVYTLPDVPYSSWFITGAVANVDDVANYTELAVVVTNGNQAALATSMNAALLNIALSGLDVRITQNSGANQVISWTCTRIA